MHIRTIGGFTVVAALVATVVLSAQQPAPAVVMLRVQGSVSAVMTPAGNMTVQVGKNGVVLVDTPPVALVDAARAEIAKLSQRPVRHLIQTSMSDDRIGSTVAVLGLTGARGLPLGSGLFGFGTTGASRPNVAAHDNVLNRLSAATPAVAPAMLPTMTYFLPTLDLYANDEAIVLYHMPAAHTDGDSIVFFRRSDVISTGDIYTPGRYPTIDIERGGSFAGMITALGRVLDLAVSEAFSEGGTKIVPGVGRISEETDVAEFRDMLAIIGDRVKDGIAKRQTLEQVKAARPSSDYDGEYRATPADADRLVEAIYRSLTARPAGARPATGARQGGGRS